MELLNSKHKIAYIVKTISVHVWYVFARNNQAPLKPNPNKQSSETQHKDVQLFFSTNITTPTFSHIKGF